MSLAEGRELRDEALSKMEAHRKVWLMIARKWAVLIAQRDGQVTIEDVRDKISLPSYCHPNTWGAVMRCKELKAVGFTQATHSAAHARAIRTYVYNDLQGL